MKQIKRAILLLVFVACILSGQDIISANSQNDDTDLNNIMIEKISFDEIQEYWHLLSDDYGGYIPELKKTNLIDFIKSNGRLSIKNIFTGIVKFLFHEIILNGKLLGILIMLTLFSTVLQTIHSTFEQSTISKIAYFVVYIVLIYIALNSFFLVFSYTKNAINMMSSFMLALIPLLLGLLATLGNVISVSFFHPIIIFLINTSGVLVSTFILPLLFLSALLAIVSTLNKQYQVTHLANLFRSVSIGALGIFLTIFLGVMSVQGTASAIQDGVAMKTAKFITGNFIPVIGRTFTDAVDTILNVSLLLKNAIGIVGVIIIILFALFPAIKIFAIALIYKVAAAVVQPLGDGPIVTSLNIISKYTLYILACLLTVTLMFFLAVVLIVLASNVTLFLR